MKPTINYADLLRLQQALGADVDVDFAHLLGFVQKPATDTRIEIKPPEHKLPAQEPSEDDAENEQQRPTKKHQPFNYWYLATAEKLPVASAPVLINRRDNNVRQARPHVSPLITLAEAQTRLQHLLHVHHQSKAIDIVQAINTIAQNETLNDIPCKRQQRLPDSLYLLLDYSARLEPARLELLQYFHAAKSLFGPSRLYCCPINYSPNASGELILPEGASLIDKLQSNTAVLYIGDQGAFAHSAKQQQYQWQLFFKRLKQADIPVHTINLAQPGQASALDVDYLMAATMRCEGPQVDRIRHMRQALYQAQNEQSSGKNSHIEKQLAEELSVWNHPDLTQPGQIADIKVKYLNKWSRIYQHMPQPQRLSLDANFALWRNAIAKDTAAMEQLKGASLQCEEIDDPEALNQLFAIHQGSQSFAHYTASRKALIQHIIRASRSHPELKKATACLSAAVFADSTVATVDNDVLRIKQHGNSLAYGFGADIKAPQSLLPVPVLDATGRRIEPTEESALLHHPDSSLGLFESDTQQHSFKTMVKPNWAQRIWHDADGLFAAHSSGTLFQLQPANHREQAPTWEGINNAWPWASDYGVDEYGLWAVLQAKKAGETVAEFKLRWIPEGEFLMGSPDDEEGRYDDETQHRVQISQGYWMAETTCTQQQWLAIMGENPSEDKGLELPVNYISWNDCQEFTQKLLSLIEGFVPGLATEAQWEYACRASTATAYWWGDEFDETKASKDFFNLTQDNQWPSNDFGLKSMSGNIGEWCSDAKRKYPDKMTDDIIVDPRGEDDGRRVLRGGYWLNLARRLRCASRNAGSPGARDRNIGFRLAGGLDPEASTSESALTADRRAQPPVRWQS